MNILTVANLILLKGCPAVTCDILAGCSFAVSPPGVRNSLARVSHCKDLGLLPYFFLFFFFLSDAQSVLPVLQLPAACHAQCGAGAEARRLFPS